MKSKIFYSLFIYLALILGPHFAFAQEPYISLKPSKIYQGDPLMIQVYAGGALVRKITFDSKPVSMFEYNKLPTGIVGIDLNKTTGVYLITAELSNGRVLQTSVEVMKSNRGTEKYTIPGKLGGGTLKSQMDLISTLAEENGQFKNIKTGKKIWWLSGFVPPLEEPKVGDRFGYHRNLGNIIMAHKGVDYVAKEGTSVMSTNDGIVRLVGEYRNYGKTIIVDHGMGVLSFYLHLSQTSVKAGEFVYAGQKIGLSGETGYADEPHLHFSIRVYGVSVDPVKFLDLFK